MNNNFEMILDFLLNFKTNKSSIEKISSEVKKILETIQPELNLNDADAIDTIKELVKYMYEAEDAGEALGAALKGMEIDINDEAVISAINEIEKEFQNLNKIFDDLDNSEFMKSIEQLDDQLDDLPVEVIEKLSKQFANAQQENEGLLNTQKKALQELKAGGKEGSDSYKKLEKDISDTETLMKSFGDTAESSLGKVSESTDSFSDKYFKMEALSQAGEGLENFAQKGLAIRDAMLNIQGQTGKTGEELENLRDTAEELFKAGVGSDLSESLKTVGIAEQQLGRFLDEASLTTFTKQAAAIGQVFDTDVNEVLMKSRTFISNFGLDGEEAGNLVSLAMQKGGNAMGDVLDTLDEYSQLAKGAGYNAEEFVSQITSAVQLGVRDTDKLADSIKETQIRINAGDYTKPFEDMISASQGAEKALQGNVMSILDQAKAGEISVKEALQLSATAIKQSFDAGTITASMRDQLNVAVSGTMAEDIGGEMWTKIFSQPIDTDSINSQAKIAGEQIASALGPVTMFDKVKKNLDLLGANISETFATVAQTIGGSLSTVGQVAPALMVFSSVKDLVPDSAITKITSLSKDLKDKLAPSLGTATAGQKSLNLEILKNPYVWAAAAIAGLVVGLHYLTGALHETAQERKEEVNSQKELLNTQIETTKKQKELVQSNLSLADSFKAQGVSAMENGNLMLSLAQTYPGVISSSKTYEENLKALDIATSRSSVSLGKLDKELFNLAQRSVSLDIEINKINVDVAKEGIEDLLTEGKSMFMDNAFEFVIGTSSARTQSENIIKSYTKGIYEAQNSEELQKANLDFQMALFNDEDFKDLTDKEKKAIAAKVQTMADERNKELEYANKGLLNKFFAFQSTGEDEAKIIKTLAEMYGKTENQIKEMIKEQKKSKVETDKQKDAVVSLAQTWDKARQDASKAMGEQLSTANQIAKELQDGSLTPEQRKLKQAQYNEAIKNLKAQNNEKKNLDKLDELTQIRAGIIVKEGKSAYELAKEQADLKAKDLDLSQQQYEYEVLGKVLSEERQKDSYDELLLSQKQLETIQAQQDSYIKSMEARKVIAGYDSDGNIIFSTKLKDADKQEIKNTIQDYNSKIQSEQSNIQAIEVDLNLRSQELEEKLIELNQNQLEWEISVGIRGEISVDELVLPHQKILDKTRVEIEANQKQIKSLTSSMDAELSALTADATEAQRDAITTRYQSQILLFEEKNIELKGKELSSNQAIYDINKNDFDKRLDLIKDFEDKRVSAVEKSFDKQIDQLQKFNDIYANSLGSQTDKDQEKELSKIDTRKEAELSKIEEWQDMEAIGKEEAEKRKADIEEKYRKQKEKKEEEFQAKQRTFQLLAQGSEIAAENEKAVALATIQQDSLTKQMALYEEKYQNNTLTQADVEAFDALREQFDTAQGIINEKGDELENAYSQVGSALGDAMAAMFAGDSEASLQTLKDFFVRMSGMLVKSIADSLSKTALKKTLEIVGASADGWVSVIASPIIYAGVSGLLNAVAEPLLKPLSYATGGRIDEPTMAIIGDGSRLGSQNREWIFRDEQLIQTVQMASMGSNAALINEIRELRATLSQQQIQTKLKGQDMVISLNRTKVANKYRAK